MQIYSMKDAKVVHVVDRKHENKPFEIVWKNVFGTGIATRSEDIYIEYFIHPQVLFSTLYLFSEETHIFLYCSAFL